MGKTTNSFSRHVQNRPYNHDYWSNKPVKAMGNFGNRGDFSNKTLVYLGVYSWGKIKVGKKSVSCFYVAKTDFRSLAAMTSFGLARRAIGFGREN